MRHRFLSPVREPGPTSYSQNPSSTRNLPMRRCFLLTLLACTLPAARPSPGNPQGMCSPASTSPARPTLVAATSTTAARSSATSMMPAQWLTAIVHSAGVFTQIDVPGSVGTLMGSINDVGTIVGRYDAPLVNDAHGFILSGGNFTSFDVPGAAFTSARGINLAGNITGRYKDATEQLPRLPVYSGGQFTTIDYPTGTNSACSGINNNGQIVGQYNDAAGTTHGFLLSAPGITR